MPLDSAAIAKVLGIPYANVAANWPGIAAALQGFGIDSPLDHSIDGLLGVRH
jgi:hypothetical protein